MDRLFFLLFSFSSLLFLFHPGNAQPSPGYYPSSRLKPVPFFHGFTNLWGPQHQWVSRDQTSLTIWLDRNSGSGFKSIRAFRSGYFSTSIMLQRGYTAGVITAFYLSNNEAHPGFHDEVDVEFLGTKPGEPYTLQTNVYVRGSGDGRIIGREMKFHLWFDPTAAFHNYAILWNPKEIMSETDIANVVERRIWHSIEDGHFENLPGKGKPLKLNTNPHVDPAEDTLYRILSRNGCAPEWVELNKDIRSNIAEWRLMLKKAWTERLDQQDSQWLQHEGTLKLWLCDINGKVLRYNIMVPFGRQLFGLKWEKEIDRLQGKEQLAA